MPGAAAVLGFCSFSFGSAASSNVLRLSHLLPRGLTAIHQRSQWVPVDAVLASNSLSSPAGQLHVLKQGPVYAWGKQQHGLLLARRALHTALPPDLHEREHHINELLALGPAGSAAAVASTRQQHTGQQFQIHSNQAMLELLCVRTYSGTTAWDKLQLPGMPSASVTSHSEEPGGNMNTVDQNTTGLSEIHGSPAGQPAQEQGQLHPQLQPEHSHQHMHAPDPAVANAVDMGVQGRRSKRRDTRPGPVDVAYQALHGAPAPHRLGLNGERFDEADKAQQEQEMGRVVRLLQLSALAGYQEAAQLISYSGRVLNVSYEDLVTRLKSLGSTFGPVPLATGVLPAVTLPSHQQQQGTAGHEHQGLPQGGMPLSQVIPMFFIHPAQQEEVAWQVEEAGAAGLQEAVRAGVRLAVKEPAVLGCSLPGDLEKVVAEMSQHRLLPTAVVRLMVARMPRLLLHSPDKLGHRASQLTAALMSHNLPGPVTRQHGYNSHARTVRQPSVQLYGAGEQAGGEAPNEGEGEEEGQPMPRGPPSAYSRDVSRKTLPKPHIWTYTGPNIRSWRARGRGPLTHSQLLLTLQRQHQALLWPVVGREEDDDEAATAPSPVAASEAASDQVNEDRLLQLLKIGSEHKIVCLDQVAEQALARTQAFMRAMLSARPHLLLLDPKTVELRLDMLVQGTAQLPDILREQLHAFNPSDMALVLNSPTHHFSRLRFLAQLPAEQVQGEKLCSAVRRSSAAFARHYPDYFRASAYANTYEAAK